MKYCPECRSEFQDWVEKCVDCGADLVDTPPPPKPGHPKNNEPTREPLVAIASYKNNIEAELNKGILEAEGIDCITTNIDDRYVTGKASGFSNYFGISLLVRKSDAENALEILNSVEKNPADADS
jgi:hypothetical protein